MLLKRILRPLLFINRTEISKKSSGDVTVILNVWKRNYLEEQLDSLLEQTVLPKEIWILHLEHHVDFSRVIKRYRRIFPSILLVHSDLNLKYFGRYSVARHVTSEFVWILDDDIIPGKRWLERSLKKCSEKNVVVGCSGRIIPKDNFLPEKIGSDQHRQHFIGDCYNQGKINYCPAETVVDYACNSYFFKSAWISDFWILWPTNFINGEDIHLSAALKVRRNIETVVLTQSNPETSGNLRKKYSRDQYASWLKQPEFYDNREVVLRNLIQTHGWTPILWS